MKGYQIGDFVAYKEAGYADIYVGIVRRLSKAGVPHIAPVGPYPGRLAKGSDGLIVTHSSITNITVKMQRAIDDGIEFTVPERDPKAVRVGDVFKPVTRQQIPTLYVVNEVDEYTISYDRVNQEYQWCGCGSADRDFFLEHNKFFKHRQ